VGRSLRLELGGGILGLVLLLSEHPHEVEADLQRFYGVHLGDLWTGRLTFRRCYALVTALPPESALGRLSSSNWGLPEHLLACAVDELRAGNWLLAQIHSKDKLKQPKPIERPGVERKPKKVMTREMAEMLLARGPERESEVPHGG